MMDAPVALRHLVVCLDSYRVPLNREQRQDIPGDVPYWGSGGIAGHISKTMFDEDLVLLGEDGAPFFDPTRDVAFCVSGPVWINNHIHVLRPRSNVDPRFLTYSLNSVDYARYITGSTRDKLTQDDMREIQVATPPLEVQRRVADFLDDQVAQLDHAIQLRQQQAALTSEHLKEDLRVAVAGDVGSSGPSHAPWVAAMHAEGMLQPLARTLTLQRGVDLTDAERSDGPIPIFTTAGPNGFHDRAVVDGPGVVIGRYGSVGSVFWAAGPHWPHNTTLYVKDYKSNDPRWVYFLLKTYPYDRLQARAAVPGVNRNDMAPDLMPWLPLKRQQDAVRACEDAEEHSQELLAAADEHVRLLRERKQALITAAVTGEFDVSTASVRGWRDGGA